MDSLGSLICGHFAPKQWGHIHRNVHLEDGILYKTGKAPMGFWSTQQVYKYDEIEQVLRISGTHPEFQKYSVELNIG